MSSDGDPPLSTRRNQQPRRGSGYPTSTPDSSFRRPPPLQGTSEQQFSQSTRPRHTEPIRSRLVSSRPTYASQKSTHSGLSFKSATSSPVASASKSITQSRWRSPPVHLQELGQHHRAKNSRSSFPSSKKTSHTTNLSGRISQFRLSPSHALRRPPHIHVPPSAKPANIMTTKKSQAPAPLWHELDDTYEERLRVKRRRDEAGIYTAKRITGHRTSTAKSNDDTIDVEDLDRPKANIRPKLRLNAIDQPDDSDSDDEPRYRPQAKFHSRKTIRPQIAAKKSAARKVNYVDTTSSDEDSDGDESKRTSSSSSEKDQLDSDQYDVDMDELHPPRARTPPQIMILDSPPRITIPLPQIDPGLGDVPAAQPPSTEPPDELITALESLALSTLRMQKTHQLPFLLRNVREGFLSRCRALSVPIYGDNRQLSLCVQYDYVAGLTYKTDISKWLCPLCELHGTFRTREMLDCHLQWDHAEVFSEWREMDYTEESESWNLQLVIPETEIQPKIEDERYTPASTVNRKPQPRSVPNTPTSGPDATPTRSTYSPFPYVSISPSSTRRLTISASPSSYRTPSMVVETKNIARLKFQEDSDLPSRSVSPSHRSASQSTSMRPSNARASVSTITSTTVWPDRRSRYPTPPPADDLLGPAARPPYLPAKSEYGGPTVYHSYRPGGPCLFDLLNTLSLDQFGVLDWEILDREEEIYESDDVKEEYKVMHALWARWIMLNRNKFIANYFKGMITFVDEYWKIIHRAAGWDALRYWLLMLLSNHFLTGHEVAQVLVHYENHIGMAFW